MLVAGLLVFVPVIGLRTLSALDEVAREHETLRELPCDGLVDLVPAVGPVPIRQPGNIHRYTSLPAVPALWLGTLELVAPLEVLERLRRGEPHEYRCLRVAKERIRANAWTFDRIERAGQPAGLGRLVESVYLLHAGELPDHVRAQLGATACTVSRITPGSLAESGGLAVGDVLFTLDGERPPKADPCFASLMLDDLPPGRETVLGVFRAQVPFYLKVRAPSIGARFGWEVRRLPILQPNQWSVRPLLGGPI